MPEGGLAQVRQATVSSTSLAAASRDLGVDRALRLGRGEASVGRRDQDSAARRRLRGARRGDLPRERLRRGQPLRPGHARRTLRRRGRASRRLGPEEPAPGVGRGHRRQAPAYDVTSTGPPHEQRFVAVVAIAGRAMGRARARSKKAAELEAARAAWEGAMPELPEVETIRAALSRELTGKKVKSVAVTNGKLTKRHKSVKEFRALLEGHSVKSLGRLGKNLVFALDSGNHLVVHLGMSGQLLAARSAKDPKPKHTHVVFTFSQGGELRYVDPRISASSTSRWRRPRAPSRRSPYAQLAVGGDGLALRKAVPELADLGIDPVEDVVGWDRFAAILRGPHDAAEGAPHRPAHHLPASATSTPTRSCTRRGSASTARPARSRRSRSVGCTAPSARPSPTRSSTAARPWTTSSSSTPTASRHLPDSSTRSTAARVEACPRCRSPS